MHQKLKQKIFEYFKSSIIDIDDEHYSIWVEKRPLSEQDKEESNYWLRAKFNKYDFNESPCSNFTYEEDFSDIFNLTSENLYKRFCRIYNRGRERILDIPFSRQNPPECYAMWNINIRLFGDVDFKINISPEKNLSLFYLNSRIDKSLNGHYKVYNDLIHEIPSKYFYEFLNYMELPSFFKKNISPTFLFMLIIDFILLINHSLG